MPALPVLALVKLLQKIATLATDRTLQLILPYCASMFADQAASVRAAALRTMANILENVGEPEIRLWFAQSTFG